MADECTDINAHEVINVCVRSIENGAVIEMFIGCWPVTSTAAADVRDCILHALDSVGLNPGHMVAVAFDGAANMSGQKVGLQAQLKEVQKSPVAVGSRTTAEHCAAVKSILAVINKQYAV